MALEVFVLTKYTGDTYEGDLEVVAVYATAEAAMAAQPGPWEQQQDGSWWMRAPAADSWSRRDSFTLTGHPVLTSDATPTEVSVPQS